MCIVETVTDWGFNYTATRDVAQNRENTSVVSEIFSQVIYARIILMTVCFIFLLLALWVIPSLHNYRLLFILTFMYIPGHILCPQWLFQAFEQMRFITILVLLANTIFTILVFVVIHKQSDYVYQPLLTACGSLVSGIIAQYIIYNQFKVHYVKPRFQTIVKRLKGSTDMFLSLLLPNLYSNFTTIILKSYCGNFATGIYNGGQRFQNIVDNLTGILSRTFFPFLARHKDKHHIYVIISGSIAIIATIFMFFGAQWFVNIFLTSEFKDAVKVMRIFALTPIFFFLIGTYGQNYLVIIGKEHILRNIVITVSLIGFALTWWLTPKFSFIGAAITVTIVRGLYGILTYIFAKKWMRIETGNFKS